MQSAVRVLVLSLLWGLLAGGSASAQEEFDSFYVPVTWLMRPTALAPTEGEQHGALGAMLFIQTIASAREVTLSEDISVLPWGGNTTRRVTLPAGTPLLQVSGATPFAYCDPRITEPMRNQLVDVNARLCLIDRENDGVFDLLYWAGLDMRNDFMPMGLNRSTSPALSVRYADQAARPLLQAGLVVTRRSGGYRLEFAVLDGQSAIPLGDVEGLRPLPRRPVREVRFRARDLPITLTYSGAQVRINAIDDGVVRYQVISTFDSESPFGVAVTRELSEIN